jgi:glycosyltransferase involved in cell wall biosynthesis
MRILFVHSNFPGQFGLLCRELAANDGNDVVFISARESAGLKGVRKFVFTPRPELPGETLPLARGFQEASSLGLDVYRAARALADEGWYPDVVYAHAGTGVGMFLRDVFPDAKLVCLFEWYYRSEGSDADFLSPLADEDRLRIRVRNAPLLLDLEACDAGICPTQWQLEQFPAEFRPKLRVVHDGVDTDFFRPCERSGLAFADGTRLGREARMVTFATRALEEYRGFPQFLQAAAILLDRDPDLHIVVAGRDKSSYGRPKPPGYYTKQVAALGLDAGRMHMVGFLQAPEYLSLLQNSTAHVYLTVPFVLSWSCLQAMACGTLVVGSRTPPVEEILTEGRTGLMVDFFDHSELADRVLSVLDSSPDWDPVRAAARDMVVSKYSPGVIIPQHKKLISELCTSS